jgi:hypothetical protein
MDAWPIEPHNGYHDLGRRLGSELNQRMAFFAGAQLDRGLQRVCINHLACITERDIIHARAIFRD